MDSVDTVTGSDRSDSPCSFMAIIRKAYVVSGSRFGMVCVVWALPVSFTDTIRLGCVAGIL